MIRKKVQQPVPRDEYAGRKTEELIRIAPKARSRAWSLGRALEIVLSSQTAPAAPEQKHCLKSVCWLRMKAHYEGSAG